MVNNQFLLIYQASKTKDQSGPFVFLSLEEECCNSVPLGCSYGLMSLSAAFAEGKCEVGFPER